MFIYEAAGQIYIFLSCVFLGAGLGVLRIITHLVKVKSKKEKVRSEDGKFCALDCSAVRHAKTEEHATVETKGKKTNARRLLLGSTVVLGDILFVALAVPAVFFGLLWVCYGAVRFYCFLGILAGFFLYLNTLGLVVDNVVNGMYNKLKEKVRSKK